MNETLLLPAAALPHDAVEVGRIGEAWGVKGWFKVFAHSPEPEALLATHDWFLQPATRGAKNPFSGTVHLAVREARVHGDALVASAAAIADRSAAESLRGARVFVSRAAFPAPADDEFYWVDLIGLAVRNREGQALGTVKSLLPSGPQTTLVLEYADEEGKPRERLIPFVSAFVDRVDLPGKCIEVDWQADY
ncbi:ribosome maturation factor RimM [Comamonas sp. NLF-1-9]|uniref:ribosome maturation factor RimM n=1 Tax=Comamonas sp. NLF-1-9 TaxID=2853163 RepID=UPI001C47A784|nr:ribosome maturation factor RimM [Comamonas sp. NLF-1-9]QXL84458.1 ribosome maturation factor RimM [Comamonas sp. NLF-1-9]